MKKKILFVAMSDSIHTARWINQLVNSGFKIYLFSSNDTTQANPEIINTLLHIYFPAKFIDCSKLIMRIKNYHIRYYLGLAINLVNKYLAAFIGEVYPQYRVNYLTRVIDDIKPDIIHSMNIQSAGYLTLHAKKLIKDNFPDWIVTNWGSDISLFGNDPIHANKISQVLSNCDYYSCECNRDVKLAQKFGFKGKILDVMPNAGGYDLNKYNSYSLPSPSQRRYIMVKGYQGWAGRSFVALDAIDLIGKTLFEKKYGLIIYSMAGNLDVENKSIAIARKHHLHIKLVPQFTAHDEIIKLHGQSRISIGLSIGDGISTSLLESMLTGSFPIQSYTSCADEWILNGASGILVPPEDVNLVSKAILKAIASDQLVDKAAKINRKIISERAKHDIIKNRAIKLYDSIISS